jgi:thioredoxin 1
MQKIALALALVTLLLLPSTLLAQSQQLPVPGQVTMIDLGAHKCIPCKMMAPILEKLAPLYKGHAEIIFVDVWENPDEAKRFKIAAIPTQIFFDKDGKEVYRHQGFMTEEVIVEQLAKMGVAKPHGGQ